MEPTLVLKRTTKYATTGSEEDEEQKLQIQIHDFLMCEIMQIRKTDIKKKALAR